MCVGDTKSDVMKAIHDGACDYWIKPLKENLIQNMWQHVARKMWIENKYLQFTEKLEAEGERYDSKLPLIDQKIEVINSNVKQGSVEKNNNKLESSTKKTRFKWSPELDKKFVSVVMELNADKAVPKKILAKMNVPGLTREHVASKLQKYRDRLKRGDTKKQRKWNRIVEATTESKSSNESLEFDFQAYDASTPHVVPNNFIPPESKNIINEAPFNFYQNDYEEEISSAFNNQHCNGFGTNSMFLPNGIIPHQNPMTQPLPMFFENWISS
ncbi:hypothetical protein P8452_09647 [Trifolium repens]|nr:hypothetical protein P8452_09647 [Trifolium repens]